MKHLLKSLSLGFFLFTFLWLIDPPENIESFNVPQVTGLLFLGTFFLIIYNKLKSIMSTQQEIAAALTALTTQVAKIGTESTATLNKVTELEAALANQENVSPELQAAFDGLKTQVQTVDDLVTDAVAVPTPEVPAP